MLYFIEHDLHGNIVHVNASPILAFPPLNNCVVFHDKNGKAHVDAQGKPASHYGHQMLPPIEVDKEVYDLLSADNNLQDYYWNMITDKLAKRPLGL